METIKISQRPSMSLSVDLPASALVESFMARPCGVSRMLEPNGGDITRALIGAAASAAAASPAIADEDHQGAALSVNEPIYAAATFRTQGPSVTAAQRLIESVDAAGVNMQKQGTGVSEPALTARQGVARGVPPRGPGS